MIFTIFGDYVRHYGNKIWIGSLINLMKEFGHNEQSVRVALSRMTKQGWFEAERQGRKSYYYLTEQGIARIEEAASRIFKLEAHEWDGKWRMLMYTIPEEKRQQRDDLRKELLWSGFGNFSNGCWITPNDLAREVRILIKKYDIEDYTGLFLAEYTGPKSDREIVKSSWPLEDIQQKYIEFISEYSQKYIISESAMESGQMSDAECFVERTNLVHEYRKFLFIDPGLPRELLPEKWSGSHAAHLFASYYKLLAEPASRFFESVFEKDNDISLKNKSYDAEEHSMITKN